MSPSHVISAEHFTLHAGKRCLLRNVTFGISPGEWVALVGPSGSGKSRLLAALMGFAEDWSGTLSVNGHQPARGVHPPHRAFYSNLAAVFQESALLDELTVAENIALAGGTTTSTHDLLARVGLNPDNDATKLPSQLSGGMARRVALARAIARVQSTGSKDSTILFLDEPLAGVDAKTRDAIVEQLIVLRSEQPRLTVVLVAHEQDVIARLCDRALVLDPAEQALTPIALDRAEPDTAQHHLADALTAVGKAPPTSTHADDIGTELRDTLRMTWRAGQEAVLLAPRLVTAILAGFVNPRFVEFTVRYAYLSLPFVLVVCLIIGLSMVIQSEAVLAPLRQATRLPEAMALGIVQGIGPLLIALLMAGRAGASQSGEVSIKRLTRQWEALWLCGKDADRELFAPRAAGLLTAMPILTIGGIAAALFSGALYFGLGFSPTITDTFYISDVVSSISTTSVVWALVRAVCFGLGITLCAFMVGRRPPRSSSDTAEATTLASTLAAGSVILLDFFFRLVGAT